MAVECVPPHVVILAVRPTPTPEPWYMPAFRKLLQGVNVPPPTVPLTPPLSLTGSLPSTYNETYNDRIDKSER